MTTANLMAVLSLRDLLVSDTHQSALGKLFGLLASNR
jgi:hypothetical protein